MNFQRRALPVLFSADSTDSIGLCYPTISQASRRIGAREASLAAHEISFSRRLCVMGSLRGELTR
jgi:hypothetical protein